MESFLQEGRHNYSAKWFSFSVHQSEHSSKCTIWQADMWHCFEIKSDVSIYSCFCFNFSSTSIHYTDFKVIICRDADVSGCDFTHMIFGTFSLSYAKYHNRDNCSFKFTYFCYFNLQVFIIWKFLKFFLIDRFLFWNLLWLCLLYLHQFSFCKDQEIPQYSHSITICDIIRMVLVSCIWDSNTKVQPDMPMTTLF